MLVGGRDGVLDFDRLAVRVVNRAQDPHRGDSGGSRSISASRRVGIRHSKSSIERRSRRAIGPSWFFDKFIRAAGDPLVLGEFSALSDLARVVAVAERHGLVVDDEQASTHSHGRFLARPESRCHVFGRLDRRRLE